MSLNILKENTNLKNYLTEPDANEELSVLIHDLKNHLFIIDGFIEMKEYDIAQKKIQELCEKISQTRIHYQKIKSNSICQTLIEKEIYNLKKLNINVICDVQPIKINHAIESDLCVILGNALDNAREACTRIKSKELEKTISIKMLMIDNNISLSIENTSETTIKVENGKIVTCKKDFKKHGLGLKSIKSLVQKYNGNMEIMQKNNKVLLNIIIPTF